MKKLTLYFLCFLTTLFSHAQSWQELPTLNQGNELFQYGSTLYATGGGGEQMYFATSTDGGDTWQVDPLVGQTMEMGGPVAGMFLDEQLGFLGLQGSFRGEILRTEDGGANWESVYYSDIISGEYENT
ncbi:MAG: hypothetical protein KDC44_11795, partial [Phaeodactylibacter sp.]|nr:hypothetical protein [Phaeodactylibacter sp.]